jgi:hypothetical protein
LLFLHWIYLLLSTLWSLFKAFDCLVQIVEYFYDVCVWLRLHLRIFLIYLLFLTLFDLRCRLHLKLRDLLRSLLFLIYSLIEGSLRLLWCLLGVLKGSTCLLHGTLNLLSVLERSMILVPILNVWTFTLLKPSILDMSIDSSMNRLDTTALIIILHLLWSWLS